MRELSFKGTGKLHAVRTILRQNRFDPKTKNSDYDIYVTAKIEYQEKKTDCNWLIPSGSRTREFYLHDFW